MSPIDIQKKIFDHIKSTLPPHIALADEISSIFNISHDSAYRRLRGETLLSLGELQEVCHKYNISLDHFLNLQNGSVVFRATDVPTGNEGFLEYLKSVLAQMQFFNQFKNRELFYLCKDIPIFHFFHNREFAAFKSYFWMRSIINDTSVPEQFDISSGLYTKYFDIGQQIISEYNKLPSTELWNPESINSSFHQIEYYREAGIFASAKDIETVYDSFEQVISHLQEQCKAGIKFFYGRPAPQQGFEFRFFVNELILGSNTIIAKTDDRVLTFITHWVLNFMGTTDQQYGEKVLAAFHSLANRSMLVSKVGEKERNRFFNRLREQVKYYRKRI